MAKKLWIFPLTLLLLMGSVAFANDGNVIQIQIEKATKPAMVQKQGVLPQEMKKIRVHGRGTLVSTPVSEGGNTTSIQAEKTEQPVLDPEGDVIPVHIEKAKKPALIKKHGYLYPGRSEIEPLGSRDELPHGYIFNYDDEDSEYYLSGGIAGDEWGIWFQSAQAACSLYAVEWQFFGGVPGGTINFNVMKAGTVWPDTVVNADSIAVEDIFGDNLMGTGLEFPLEMEATSDWERFEFPEWGFFIDVDSSIFWIHWTKTGDYPMLLGDSDNLGDYLHTWDYEPNQDGDWKWSHYGWDVGIEAMVRCEVVFYEDPPPTVMANQMNDTYRTDAITLTADAWDNALDPALEGIASGNLIYSVNGVFDTLTATVTGDTAIGFTLTATIPAGATGDIVEYYFEAWDLADLYGRSFPALSFERTEPVYPDANLLLLRNGVSSSQHDLFELVLDSLGYVYEIWDADDRHGIDESVVGFGWDVIVAYGWGGNAIPMFAADTDPGFGAFIDGGGNLFYSDMDYMCGSSAGCGDAVFDWVEGDFAYNYFGLASGQNDPGTIEIVPITGLNVTPIDIPFVSSPLTLNHAAYLGIADAGWIDYITVGDATAIFDDGSNVVGSTLDHSGTGGGIAVYLSFMADAAGDTLADGSWDHTEFATLLDGVIDYLNVTSPPSITDVDELITTIDTGPFEISATIKDADGDAITATLWWSDDGGTTENDVAMTADGDVFSAEIPQLTLSETTPVYYYIEASSAGQSVATDEFDFWVFVTSADVLYFWDDIYSNFDYQDGLHLDYDEYDPWVYGLPDSTLITNDNYTTVVWNADLVGLLDNVYYYDMVDQLEDFVDGGGNLALSSDELLGVETGWYDTTFAAGDFFYDYMGIDSVFNDVGVDSLIAVDGDPVTDGLTFGTYAAWYYAWADKVTATNGGVVMITDQTGDYGFGVRREGTGGQGKTTFLAFVSTYMDVSEYGPLFDGILTWFGHTVSIDEQVVVLPEVFKMHQNYPNPFNPVTNLKFDLPKRADVKLVIYNMLGQEVSTLINRDLRAGYHNVLWNGTDKFGQPVGSGVYIYRIKAGDFTSSKKMLLLK